jgi:phosphatidylglycerophosphatase A
MTSAPTGPGSPPPDGPPRDESPPGSPGLPADDRGGAKGRASDESEEAGAARAAAKRLSDEASLIFDARVEVATCFGIGHIPVASGTFGSAAAIPLAVLLAYLGPTIYIASTAVIVLMAIWCAQAASRHFGLKDPHEVVIDEVAGQLTALALVPISLPAFVGGFLLFRFFDIVKPYPANRLELLPGGYGIVLDDIAAGLYANLVLHGGLRVASWARGS